MERTATAPPLNQLLDLEESLRALSRSLDPAVLAPVDALAAQERFLAIAKLAHGAVTVLAARAAESGRWRQRGALSPAHDLAQRAGTTVGSARDALDASTMLPALAATAEAVREGRLSVEQAAAVAQAAHADPAAEAKMLRRAERDSLAGLRDERDRVKAAAAGAGDAAAAHARLVRTRSLRFGTAPDGAGTGSWRLPPDAHAELKALLAPFAQAAFDRARREGRHDNHDAYAADGLLDLARTSLTPAAAPPSTTSEGGANTAVRDEDVPPVLDLTDGPTAASNHPASEETAAGGSVRRRAPAKVIVRVDHTALLRGHTVAGETCEIAGVGPVPVAAVTQWIATGDVFLAALITRGVDVATVAHLGRRPNATQLTALHWRDPTCRVEGCHRPVREWDHHVDWAHSRHTLLADTGGLCTHHHDHKTYRHYRLAPSPLPAKIRLLPPDDPDPPPRE